MDSEDKAFVLLWLFVAGVVVAGIAGTSFNKYLDHVERMRGCEEAKEAPSE